MLDQSSWRGPLVELTRVVVTEARLYNQNLLMALALLYPPDIPVYSTPLFLALFHTDSTGMHNVAYRQ